MADEVVVVTNDEEHDEDSATDAVIVEAVIEQAHEAGEQNVELEQLRMRVAELEGQVASAQVTADVALDVAIDAGETADEVAEAVTEAVEELTDGDDEPVPVPDVIETPAEPSDPISPKSSGHWYTKTRKIFGSGD